MLASFPTFAYILQTGSFKVQADSEVMSFHPCLPCSFSVTGKCFYFKRKNSQNCENGGSKCMEHIFYFSQVKL